MFYGWFSWNFVKFILFTNYAVKSLCSFKYMQYLLDEPSYLYIRFFMSMFFICLIYFSLKILSLSFSVQIISTSFLLNFYKLLFDLLSDTEKFMTIMYLVFFNLKKSSFLFNVFLLLTFYFDILYKIWSCLIYFCYFF